MSSRTSVPVIRVLLVEDDPDDFVLTRDLLDEVEPDRFEVEWARTCDEGLQALAASDHDIVLLDYRLGEETGLDFLGRMPLEDQTPVILLTGQADREVDLEAMRSGAADYLVKSEVTPTLLERAIRYVIEQHHTQQARREAELRYRLVVETAGAIVRQADPETFELSLVSQEAEVLLGYPVERWLEDPEFWPAHIHPEDRSWVVPHSRETTARGEPYTLEYRMIAADGRVVWLRDIVRVVELEGRARLVGVMVDITERKQAEEALRLHDRALASINEGVLITDARHTDNPILYANRAFEHLTGYSAGEVVGKNCRFLQGPGTDPAVVAAIRAAVDAEQGYAGEILNYRKDGTPFWNRLSITPLHDDAGALTHFVVTQLDVTERVAAEKRLRSAEAHYRRLVTTAPQAIYALDREGRFIELNPAGEALLDRSLDALLGEHFGQVLTPADLPLAEDLFRRIISGEADHAEEELHIVRPSGEERLLNVAVAPIQDGSILGLHGIARDITDERVREQRMRMLATALDGLAQGVSVISSEGRFLYTNRAHAQLLGYEAGTFWNQTSDPFLPDAGAREQLAEIGRALDEEESWSGRIQRRRLSDGQVLWLDAIVSRAPDPRGDLLFTILQDATEAIARERHLRRTERLASLGTLIGGVAHELNNPLHAIRNFAELMLHAERGAEDQEALEIIQREADRAARVVAALRRIARETQNDQDKHVPVDLNDVVRHVLKVRQYSLHTSDVEVHQHLTEQLPRVLASRSEMEQVVLNLIVNAEQAMQGQENRYLVLRTRPSATGVTLHVEDSGPGIPAEHLERVFDAFFTTKSPGEGTGLGLSLVHSIVTEHGGQIQVESEPGKGTLFRIDLPSARDGSDREDEVHAPAQSARALRILVVDDEDAVRLVSVRFLERLGHQVDEAAEGAEALRRIEQTDYDVILSDLRMPGLGGEQLLERLRESGTGLERRLIFMTGAAASPQAMRELTDADTPVLLKPVRLQDLAQAIETVVQAQEQLTDRTR